AYAGAKQFNKAVDAAGEMINKGLDSVLNDPKTGPSDQLKVLFTTCQAITAAQNPTADELAIGDKAARQLRDYNKKREGVTEEAWGGAKAQWQAAANGALMSMAVTPGMAAMAKTPPDCATAETVFTKALQDYPDKSFISYNLGRALN